MALESTCEDCGKVGDSLLVLDGLCGRCWRRRNPGAFALSPAATPALDTLHHAEAEQDAGRCPLSPPGWRCTLPVDHPGLCDLVAEEG